ncbi:MAG TPA: hypothetical protein VK761_06380 [Solirubrobacteraceae bacterium]|jgi:hypothetical protein|nr:hypothetical protein [Solirubrobacteraceae bacterium]
MTLSYSAFGLQLRSEFPLPGMTRRSHSDGGLPLALELTTPAALIETWSGDERTARWRGRLSDGSELSVARGPAADLLFVHADQACFRLDPPASRLQCAPHEQHAEWQRTLLGRILPNVRFSHGCEALHASAVVSSRGVVAIAGQSGGGKTTLALELIRRGMPLLCDDVLILSSEPAGVVGHPATPHMNVDERAAVAIEHRDLARFANERWIEVARCATEPALLDAVCILERDPKLSLDVARVPANPLSLAPFMLGLPDDEVARERERFELYSALTRQAQLLRVTAGLDTPVEQVADALEHALVANRLATAGAA